MKTDIFLFTRFSVLIPTGGFNLRGKRYHSATPFIPVPLRRKFYNLTKPKTLDDRRKFLFNPERLADRSWFFENVSLPSIMNQRNKNFHHIVLHSDELPQDKITWLQTLSQKAGFRMLPMSHTETIVGKCREVILETLAKKPNETRRVASLRVDDDDALFEGFVDNLARMADYGPEKFMIQHPDGIQLIFKKGKGLQPTSYHAPFNAQGQTLVENFQDTPQTIFDVGRHTLVAKHFPVLLMPDDPAYLVGCHIHNNSARFSNLVARAPKNKLKMDDVPWERFGVNPQTLMTF